MEEKLVAQLIAELKEATGQAIGILTLAVAAQVDATRLAADLRAAIDDGAPPTKATGLAIEMARYAILVADQVGRQQKPKMH